MVSVAVNPPPPSSTRGLAHYARAHSISPYGCERVSLVYFRIFRAAGFSEYAGKRGTKVAPGIVPEEPARAYLQRRRRRRLC